MEIKAKRARCPFAVYGVMNVRGASCPRLVLPLIWARFSFLVVYLCASLLPLWDQILCVVQVLFPAPPEFSLRVLPEQEYSASLAD